MFGSTESLQPPQSVVWMVGVKDGGEETKRKGRWGKDTDTKTGQREVKEEQRPSSMSKDLSIANLSGSTAEPHSGAGVLAADIASWCLS